MAKIAFMGQVARSCRGCIFEGAFWEEFHTVLGVTLRKMRLTLWVGQSVASGDIWKHCILQLLSLGNILSCAKQTAG